MLNTPQARKRDVTMFKNWISRPDLGGGIPFSGDDLSPVGKNVYDDTFADDIMILKNRDGESDTFTRILAGPVFHGLEKLLRCMKVCKPIRDACPCEIINLPRSETCAMGSRRSSCRDQSFPLLRRSSPCYHRHTRHRYRLNDPTGIYYHPLLCTKPGLSTSNTVCMYLSVFSLFDNCDQGQKNRNFCLHCCVSAPCSGISPR
jgi:hypothetical protein